MDQLKPSLPNLCSLTPLSFLERASIVYGECASVVHNSTVYTWSDTYTRCRRLASSISAVVGPGRGQVVSVVAPNIPATYELQFAVLMAGAVINNINTRPLSSPMVNRSWCSWISSSARWFLSPFLCYLPMFDGRRWFLLKMSTMLLGQRFRETV